MKALELQPLPVVANALGESPVWHAEEQALYWVDIARCELHRWDWGAACHRQWQLNEEPGCVAPIAGGGLLLALRSGLVRFDPERNRFRLLVGAPYDTATQRFNDGKVDPWGRFWVGTIYEPRNQPVAQLYRLSAHGLEPVWKDCTVSNGLAWAPNGAVLYWADTWAHTLTRTGLQTHGDAAAAPTLWRRFVQKDALPAGVVYEGRPDGGVVDAEGCYWSAMYEGARLVRFSEQHPDADTHLHLPVVCPTMPCFAGPKLDTLVITTARHQRSDDELRHTPLAGRVLVAPSPVPGTCPPLLDPKTLPAS